jgi:hypothetical protein
MALTIDPSDAMPLGGYILPNFPKGYFISDNPNAQQLAGVVDQVLDLARQDIHLLDLKYNIEDATGTDIDDIGTIFDIPRLVGELDDPYRDRIKNSIAFGVGASSNAQMERYLSAVLGTNVTVGDGPAGSASLPCTSSAMLPSPVVSLPSSRKSRPQEPSLP